MVSRAENKGNRPDYLRQLDDACSAPPTLKLKVGAQVSRGTVVPVLVLSWVSVVVVAGIIVAAAYSNSVWAGHVADVPPKESIKGAKQAEQHNPVVGDSDGYTG